MHPTKEELKAFEEAKKHCPFCDEPNAMTPIGENILICSNCERVLVCNDIGLFEETDEG